MLLTRAVLSIVALIGTRDWAKPVCVQRKPSKGDLVVVVKGVSECLC